MDWLILAAVMFILLKVLLFFFRPLTWIVILFLIAFLSKSETRKRKALIAGLVLLLFFSNPFIIHQIADSYQTKPIVVKADRSYTAGILLGGLVSYNRFDQAGYFNSASDRFIQTALLYKKGMIRNIIVAAGNGYMTGNNFREAIFIKEKLVVLDIPAEAIITDTSSRNTLENARNSKRIVDSLHLSGPFLLISSSMHLPRASMVFKKAGIPVDLYPCDFESKNVGNNFLEDYLIPSTRALDLWNSLLKEIVGIGAYKLTGKG